MSHPALRLLQYLLSLTLSNCVMSELYVLPAAAGFANLQQATANLWASLKGLWMEPDTPTHRAGWPILPLQMA